MSLPIQITSNRDLTQLQTLWAAQLNPLLSLPTNQGQLLQNVSLVAGDNQINHKLGRKLQGWYIVRMRNSFVQVYDKQDSNRLPELTLALFSNGTCNVDLFVF